MLDGGQDLLLILHVFDLLVPDDVLEGEDLECVITFSLFMLTEKNPRKLSWDKVIRLGEGGGSLKTQVWRSTCSYSPEHFQMFNFHFILFPTLGVIVTGPGETVVVVSISNISITGHVAGWAAPLELAPVTATTPLYI